MNRRIQIHRSVPIFRQIRRSATVFVQIRNPNHIQKQKCKGKLVHVRSLKDSSNFLKDIQRSLKILSRFAPGDVNSLSQKLTPFRVRIFTVSVVCNLCKSSPSLFKGNFVDDQNNSKYCDGAPSRMTTHDILTCDFYKIMFLGFAKMF